MALAPRNYPGPAAAFKDAPGIQQLAEREKPVSWYETVHDSWMSYKDSVTEAHNWYGTNALQQQRLMRGVYLRVQGPDENVRAYITSMMGTMKRLESPMPPGQQSDIIHGNMLADI